MIKAVFFDAFRTIFDTLGTHTEATRLILEKWDAGVDHIEFHERWDDNIMRHWRGNGGFRLLWPIFEDCLDETFRYYGTREYDVKAAIELWLDLVASAPPFPEAERIVSDISSKYKTAIVSNSDNFEMKLCLGRFDAKFDAVFTSEDVRSYKPRPELFNAALEHFNIGPDDAIMVGDSLSADVDGAHNAGIRCVWINRNGKLIPPGGRSPDFELPDLEGLHSIVSSV